MLTPTMDLAYFPKKFGGIHDRYFSKGEILLIAGNDAIAYPLYHGYYDIFWHFPDNIGKISYGKI